MTDIILTRLYHPPEDEFGYLSQFSYVEISNGLCWLAAVARKHGYAVEIIDALPLRLSNEKLCELILDKAPKYVGISACTMDIYNAGDFAAKLKKNSPSIKVIIGGPHITAVPEETMRRFPLFDIGVVGEGESTMLELLQTLDGNGKGSIGEVDGIIYRESGDLRTTKPRAFIEDLDTLPLPAWEMLPDLRTNYFAPPWTMHGGKTATIVTSRGCPSQCIYCDRRVFGNRVRYHSAGYVLDMIRTLRSKYGIRHLRIADDNFILNKKRLHEICRLLADDKLDITWSCLARVDSIDSETLAIMKKAGCWSIAFGVETGSQKIHDLEKKKVTLEQIYKAVALTRKAGIKTIGFNMIGHPTETVETIKQTINFNKKIKIDDFKTQFMNPFPGTELYRDAEKYGVFNKDWQEMTVFKPTFIPTGLTKEDLIRWNKRGFWSFYTQPRIILNYIKNIRKYSELKMLFLGALTMFRWKAVELRKILFFGIERKDNNELKKNVR